MESSDYQDIQDAIEQHRDDVETVVTNTDRDEVAAFIPTSRLDAPKGFPNLFHELTEMHVFRIVDGMVLPPAGEPSRVSVENPLDEEALALFLLPEHREKSEYDEHWDDVAAITSD